MAKVGRGDERARLLRRLRRRRFARIRFRGLDAVVIRVSDSAPLLLSVQAKIEQGQPSRWYPVEGGAHLVKWPYTGEGALPEGHWLVPGGWDHEHFYLCWAKVLPG